MKRLLKVMLVGVLALVVLLGLSVAAMAVTGWPRGVVTNVAEVQLSAPPAAVFPFLVEPERLKAWLGGLSESVPLTEGGPRVGARSREVVTEGGERVEMVTEITRYERNRLMAVHITADGFTMDATYQLWESSGGTKLRYEAETKFEPVMFRLLAPLIQPEVQQKLERDLRRLKQLAESGLTVEPAPR
ncbi:MAG TPA: SRPBCC family protein [Myxococcaceae bacterium]|nr:SRPBCC family protein [Myxococcaceae bacterium]